MIPDWTYFDSQHPVYSQQSRSQVAKAQLTNLALGDLLSVGLRRPDTIAILDHRQQYSFAQLDSLSRQIAGLLAEYYGLQAGQAVLILTQKHCLVPAVAIALWQLGLIYVPFDGDSPAERIATVAGQLLPGLLIDFTEQRDGLAGLSCPRLSLTELLRDCADFAGAAQLPSHQFANQDVVYILHTSGSTGEPKGVQITEGNLKQYFRGHNRVLRFTEQSKVFSLTPFHFDVSIEDTLLPLSVGATVYQYNRLPQGAVMRKSLIQQQVTHLIAVSTILTMISEDESQVCRANFPCLEMVMTGAEVCAPKVINLWKQRLPEARIINAYGPTEVTIVATCYTIETVEPDRELAYPIGQPLAGVAVLLLNAQGQPVAEGQAGELCLGGDQVMLGYLNRPDETAARIFSHAGIRYYRTGDRCYVDGDGQLQFVGRDDGEVKINGRRIHLGEVQQQCLAVAGVDRAAVGVHPHQGKELISAVLVAADAACVERVKSHLAQLLPAYMVPVIWGHADKIRLSASGKSNDKQLLTELGQAFDRTQRSVISLIGSQGDERV
ncbi:amino acid adenylation domain-containing protein [Reinekea sp.]|uniref:amino acid adenylation domain-containing protein n=1 Tax=Reinekea sp. TaxID=1970455 RepID=UPI0025795105|nr:amino acid adenylation domain-containing protein [Reinekea sp.]